jgi:putative ABC transport system permease protein
MTAIRQEIWHALRWFVRAPRFACVAIATLALGIGANTATFSVVNAVLLKPLPFRDAERLMLVNMLLPDRSGGPGAYREMVWSYPKYRSFADNQQAFDAGALFAAREFNLTGDDDPQHVRGELITDGYAALLGLQPVLGREFTYDEANLPGGAPVAMLSHALWRGRYGGDSAVVGRTIEIDATPHTVVGVLPRGFSGLSGDSAVWLPLAQVDNEDLDQPSAHGYMLVARRRASVSEESAIASARLTGDQVWTEYRGDAPDAERESATAVSLYASRVDGDIRRASLVLLGAVAFVLLIACVNLTNLLLAKTIERRREVAIRVALGASRTRIGRQFFIESMLLAALGALAGLAIAELLLSAATALLPDSDVFFRSSFEPGERRIVGAPGLTRIGASMVGLDGATLLFTFGVTIVTAGLVSLVPMLQASSLRPIDVLKAGGSAAGWRGRRDFAVRAAPMVAQVALALVLLVGAGLMVRSALQLLSTAVGVDPAGVLTVRLELPEARYRAEQGGAFYDRLLERVRSLPGIESAGFGSCAPVSGFCNQTRVAFINPRRDDVGLIGMHWATPDYFSTLGIPLLEGRNFEERDRAARPKVVLINEAAARAYWPNETPIGKVVAVFQGGFQDGAEVIGVVADARYRTIESAATPDAYVPLAQSYRSRMQLFVRSGLPHEAVANAVSREVRALDPTLPLAEVKTMEARVDDAMWRTRAGAWLLGAFAFLALLLTAIGIFGVMAQTVAQRTSEIGVRMALGAESSDVVRLMLRRAAVVTLCGVAVGIVAALGFTRLLESMLYGVRAHDPLTFAAVTVLLAVVALLACYLPAHRAARVDAVVALRSD